MSILALVLKNVFFLIKKSMRLFHTISLLRLNLMRLMKKRVYTIRHAKTQGIRPVNVLTYSYQPQRRLQLIFFSGPN